MEGYDAVIFAYGQTASGKTFTLVCLVLFYPNNKLTRTQSGTPANPGIIPQAVSEIFNYIRQASPHKLTGSFALTAQEQNKDQEFLLRASYLEIYNETLKDLLDPDTAPKIRQDANVILCLLSDRKQQLTRHRQKRFFVTPLREEVVTSEVQVAALLRRGEANRHVGATDFNERSSRSHSVFQIVRSFHDLGLAQVF